MLKRLWFESEMSTLSENEQKSFQTNLTFNNRSPKKNHLLEINHKNQILNSIGIQTTIIRQIDRRISCHLIQSSRSLNSISDTTVSNEKSTHTDSTYNHNDRYRRNRNRNNNVHTEQINTKDFKMKNSMTKLLVIMHLFLKNIDKQNLFRKYQSFTTIFI